MTTNELKKGTRIRLACGWEGTLVDNLKGNTRMAEVEGYVTEIGSVYSHDIVLFQDANQSWQEVEHTEAQNKLRQTVNALGF